MSDRVVLFSPSPGRIHKVLEMPAELKQLSPFNARNHEAFSKYLSDNMEGVGFT